MKDCTMSLLFNKKMRPLQLLAILCLGQLSSANTAFAQETICEIKVSGTENTLKLKSTHDPYTISTLNLDGGFRFSGQVLHDAKTKQSKLKTFVYHESKERYVLIHASENKVDAASCASEKNTQSDFGLQRVYSHKYERELSFTCKTVCSAGATK
jgi:hypothetical protein